MDKYSLKNIVSYLDSLKLYKIRDALKKSNNRSYGDAELQAYGMDVVENLKEMIRLTREHLDEIESEIDITYR